MSYLINIITTTTHKHFQTNCNRIRNFQNEFILKLKFGEKTKTKFLKPKLFVIFKNVKTQLKITPNKILFKTII